MDKRNIGDRIRDLCLLESIKRNKSMKEKIPLILLFIVVPILGVYFGRINQWYGVLVMILIGIPTVIWCLYKYR